jgi:uncharacterized protein with WD repeat
MAYTRFHNAVSHTTQQAIDSGSQVCNLAWSANVNELVSTHGYSQNAINIWRYPNLSKVATLTAHNSRVLYLSISPDGKTIVTGAGARGTPSPPCLERARERELLPERSRLQSGVKVLVSGCTDTKAKA